MAYTPITTSDLLKQYFEPGMKAQFFNKKPLEHSPVFFRGGKGEAIYELSGPPVEADGIRMDIGMRGATDAFEIPPQEQRRP